MAATDYKRGGEPALSAAGDSEWGKEENSYCTYTPVLLGRAVIFQGDRGSLARQSMEHAARCTVLCV